MFTPPFGHNEPKINTKVVICFEISKGWKTYYY